jgi:hypothetical protein
MYRSVLFERSCYLVEGLEAEAGCWSWATVLDALLRAEDGGAARSEVPLEIQRPGATVGLAVGLAVRQLAILSEDVGFWGWPLRLAA